jgi:hypothetical protein
MRKTIVLLAVALVASQVCAQTTRKHKPSAAVRGKAVQHPTTAAAPAVSNSQHSTTKAADSTPAANATAPVNGPVYEDEKMPAPAAVATARKTTASVVPSELPTGTAIRMKLQKALSTGESHEGDAFSGRVTEAVVVKGMTVIPVGASISGRVTRVSDPRRFAGTGSLRLMPESVMLPNGNSFAINAAMVDTSTPSSVTVDDEGRIKAKGVSSGDKVEMIAGTGTGAIIGTIAGGGKGLLVGSMIGGGAAVVHWMTKRHPLEIPAGTELIMEINRPMIVSTMAMNAGE